MGHWNYHRIAIYYKSLSVECLWLKLLWHYRSFNNTSVSGASRRLSTSVSFAIRFLFSDFTSFIVENVLYSQSHTRMCFQTSSAFLVQNLLVLEIYLCWRISRSSLQSLTPLAMYIFIIRCYAYSNSNYLLLGWAINLVPGPLYEKAAFSGEIDTVAQLKGTGRRASPGKLNVKSGPL